MVYFLNWSKYGISPKRLRENDALSSFFKILTTSPDENGEVQYVIFFLVLDWFGLNQPNSEVMLNQCIKKQQTNFLSFGKSGVRLNRWSTEISDHLHSVAPWGMLTVVLLVVFEIKVGIPLICSHACAHFCIPFIFVWHFLGLYITRLLSKCFVSKLFRPWYFFIWPDHLGKHNVFRGQAIISLFTCCRKPFSNGVNQWFHTARMQYKWHKILPTTLSGLYTLFIRYKQLIICLFTFVLTMPSFCDENHTARMADYLFKIILWCPSFPTKQLQALCTFVWLLLGNLFVNEVFCPVA